ncbi:hypothetical protein OG742_37220 [Streptomyces sp. NBC_00828]|uniref:hypothetical protein n=1 Tax=Streptomyces sp. NBC_00828 TaxID=2903678 RepID=UPI00386AF0A3
MIPELILLLVVLAPVALAVGIALATVGGRGPHWLLAVVQTSAIGVGALCLLLACLHRIAEALT